MKLFKEKQKRNADRYLSLLLLLLCLTGQAASAEVTAWPVLDRAFSLLEKDNNFLERYNALTGSGISPLFENGVPYFFGGVSEYMLTLNYPLMTKKPVSMTRSGTVRAMCMYTALTVPGLSDGYVKNAVCSPWTA